MNYNMYELSMEVSFPKEIDCENNPIKQMELKRSFMEKELSKILPKNTISGGYLCSICEVYLDTNPCSVCSLCYEYQKENHPYKLEEKLNVFYYTFATTSYLECKLTDVDFSKMENIKVLSFGKCKPSNDNLEAQNIIIFDGCKFIFTDHQNHNLNTENVLC